MDCWRDSKNSWQLINKERMIDLISRTVIFILCFNFLITGCEPLPTYGATDVDYYRIVTNSLFYPTAECFPWEDSFCRKYPPEKEHEVIWIPHNLLNCSASVSAVSSSQEYSTLSSLPDQLPLQTCMNGNTSLSCELLCKPYYRGKWCSDFASCRFPLYILAKIGNLSEKVANGKTEKRIPLLPLHAFDRHQNIVTNSERDQTSSPISYCLRSLDSYSNSNSNSTMTSKSPEFLMMFLGDSQTQMLLFTFLRWLSGGEVQPSWDMIYRRNRIISSAGFKFQIAKYFIRDISDTSHPIKSPTNVTKILEFVRSKRHVAKKGLIVLGHGVWDLTNSNNDNILSSFEKRFRYELAEIIAAAACNYESVDIFVRNMWVSRLPHGNGLVPLLQDMNNIIEFYIKHEQKKYNNGGLNTSAVRIHLLDVWSISWQRRYEIPLPFKGDGLHWSCLSQKSRGNACEEEMGSIDDILNSSAIKSGKDEFYPQSSSLLGKPVLRAPDEVAWGAVQLMLLKLCNLS